MRRIKISLHRALRLQPSNVMTALHFFQDSVTSYISISLGTNDFLPLSWYLIGCHG